MELHFEQMLYSNLGNKILLWAISNVHTGRRFPTPVLKHHPQNVLFSGASFSE